MQPYDYTVPVQNPLQSFMGGLNIGSALLQNKEAKMKAELERQAKEAAIARQKQIDEMYGKLRSPGATVRDYEAVAMMLPKDAAETLREGYKMRTQAEQAADLADTSRVFSALKSGRSDIAISEIRKQAEAEIAAGNEAGAKELNQWLSMIEEGEDGAAAVEDMLGFNLSMMPGGKDAIESAVKYADERRKKEEFPVLMAQKEAALAKAESDADKARIEADFAEREKIAGLEKYAADTGLTKEQTNEAIARTKKLDAETAKILMELQAIKAKKGGLTPEEAAKGEDALRKELTDRTKDFRAIDQNYKIITTAETTGIGDVARIYAIMKIFDPNSVVREGEQASAQNAAGIPSWIRSAYNSAIGGGKLSEGARKQLESQAAKVYAEAKKTYDSVEADVVDIAKRRGLEVDNIVPAAIARKEAETAELPYIKEYLKTKWPAEAAKIDAITDMKGVQSLYPKTLAGYRSEAKTRSGTMVEVDY